MLYPQGVALVQVLFIATILSLMALHFTLTSRQQVDIAATMQDKISAELLKTSWQNKLLYALLTQATFNADSTAAVTNTVAKQWNFYGRAFFPAPGIQLKIQDAYGLLSLSNPGGEAALAQLLRQVELSDNDIRQLITQLYNRQGLKSDIYQQRVSKDGRDIFMQSVTELRLIPGLTELQYRQLSPAIFPLPIAAFNPLTAPDIRLKAILPASVAAQVIQLREAQLLDAATYIGLAGTDDFEQISFVPGQLLLLEVEATYGTAVAKSRFICYIRPENQFPLIWLD